MKQPDININIKNNEGMTITDYAHLIPSNTIRNKILGLLQK